MRLSELKETRAASLRARAERAEARGDTRLARYLFVRAEDVLDTERRTRNIRPTSKRRPRGDLRRSPYTPEDDVYRAGRSAENCVIRLFRRWRAVVEPVRAEKRERRANPTRRNRRRGFSQLVAETKCWDIIG